MELKDTIELMKSDNYIERFEAEYEQARIRLGKLTDLLAKYYAYKLTFKLDCPISLLERQREIMLAYVDILERRAIQENINLD